MIEYKYKPSLELEIIDANCNNCKHMIRDMETFKKWSDHHEKYQLEDFELKKKHALMIANQCEDEKGKKTLLNIANKMKFQFDKSSLISYGHCEKFNKMVSFLPNTCQIETQECFQHRRLI